MLRSGTLLELNQETWPGCYYARSDASDVARVEQRTFVCSLSEDAAGPTNNWDEPVRDAAEAEGPLQRRHARPDDVRAAVQHGDRRLADVAGRRPAHRLSLRRRQHADHGEDRAAGVRGDRSRRAARRAVHAQRRRAVGAGPAGRALAVQRRQVHRPLPGDARDLVVRLGIRRQRAARARSASACGSPRTSRATTAGWPSTC